MKVQIFECNAAGRTATNVVELDDLLRYARDRLPPVTLQRVHSELEAQGATRIDGDGHWFEYERVD